MAIFLAPLAALFALILLAMIVKVMVKKANPSSA